MPTQLTGTTKTARSVAGLGAAAAMGLLAVALPGAAVTAANAAPITPQPCAPSSVPTTGQAWLSAGQVSCAGGSVTVTSNTAKAGETVTFTVQLDGAGARFVYGVFPVLVEDQDNSVDSHTVPELTWSERNDDDYVPYEGRLWGEDNDIFDTGGFGLGYLFLGGTKPGESEEYDSDFTQTATIQFSATVAPDAAPGSTFTVALGQPAAQGDEEDLLGMLELGILGCTTAFTEGGEIYEYYYDDVEPLGGNWTIVSSDTRSGPLCTEVTVVSDEEQPPPPAPTNTDTKKPALANTGSETPTAAFAALGGLGAVVAGAAMLTARAKRARKR